jgi:hypothetical protein
VRAHRETADDSGYESDISSNPTTDARRPRIPLLPLSPNSEAIIEAIAQYARTVVMRSAVDGEEMG